MKTCLIVDDSKVIRKVARHILETLDFEVDEPATGRKPCTRCEAKMPDVVLLDWNMPVMSGMEFLRLLRQRGHRTSPKCLLHHRERHGAYPRGPRSRCRRNVMKPFDRETFAHQASARRRRLGKAVERALARSRDRQPVRLSRNAGSA